MQFTRTSFYALAAHIANSGNNVLISDFEVNHIIKQIYFCVIVAQ